MIYKRNFECEHCGECCKLVIRVTKKDVEKIEDLGYKKGNFLMPDFIKGTKKPNCLKLVDGKCVFLKEKNGKSSCRIYAARPKACRDYPFFHGAKKLRSCRPWHMCLSLNLKNKKSI